MCTCVCVRVSVFVCMGVCGCVFVWASQPLCGCLLPVLFWVYEPVYAVYLCGYGLFSRLPLPADPVGRDSDSAEMRGTDEGGTWLSSPELHCVPLSERQRQSSRHRNRDRERGRERERFLFYYYLFA